MNSWIQQSDILTINKLRSQLVKLVTITQGFLLSVKILCERNHNMRSIWWDETGQERMYNLKNTTSKQIVHTPKVVNTTAYVQGSEATNSISRHSHTHTARLTHRHTARLTHVHALNQHTHAHTPRNWHTTDTHTAWPLALGKLQDDESN